MCELINHQCGHSEIYLYCRDYNCYWEFREKKKKNGMFDEQCDDSF